MAIAQGLENAAKAIFVIETSATDGPGFMIAPDILVTSYHVVKGAGANISIKNLPDVKLEYITHNEDADLIIFRTSKPMRNYISLAETVKINEEISLFTPMIGLSETLLAGKVTQKNKFNDFSYIKLKLKQTSNYDGRPVFNANAELVGIIQDTPNFEQAEVLALDVLEVKILLKKKGIQIEKNTRNARIAETETKYKLVAVNEFETTQVKRINSVSFLDDNATVASDLGYGIALWNIAAPTFKEVIYHDLVFNATNNVSEIQSIVASNDRRLIVTYSLYNKFISIWNSDKAKLIRNVFLKDGVSNCCISPDNRTIVCVFGTKYDKNYNDIYAEDVIQVFDAEKGILKKIMPGKGVYHCTISSDGSILATNNEEDICLWNIERGELIAKLEGHKRTVSYLKFSADGQKLISRSDDGTAIIWDVPTRTQSIRLNEKIRSACFTLDKKAVIAANDDGTINIYKLSDGQLIYSVKAFSQCIAIDLSVDGKLLVVSGIDYINYTTDVPRVKVWNLIHN